MAKGSPTPWSYYLIRLLFKFVLKIFYGTIVIENAHLIPPNGVPCIVCANHSNSLTDALLLVTSIPSKRRNMLRLTAKSTQFGHRTFTSWLIEASGTVPIKRRKDFADGTADNTDVMAKLVEALECGDAICLFPEGMSRYHPTIAPLKTGVARIVSDVLSRNRNNSEFEICILTCSITYMHRQNFRSDVLVTFHEPMRFRPKDHPELLAPVDYRHIRAVTNQMHDAISDGTLDSPSWELVRAGKLAAQIYAPLGTRMSLGDYVRVARAFTEAFKISEDQSESDHSQEHESDRVDDEERLQLRSDLKVYQDQLARWGVKDDRIRRPLPRHTIVSRMFVRLTWSLFLFTISLPGLVLWLPVFATTFYAVHNFKKSGPIWDTWDEIAQYKLIYGLISGLCVWFGTVVITFPVTLISVWLVPLVMWLTLRWLEDAIAAFRAFATLARLLRVGKPTLKQMHDKRADLHARVLKMAVEKLKLPDTPESYFLETGGRDKGRIGGTWDSSRRYFSVRRRRKRDWNETLRLYDQVDYPDEGT